MSDRERVNGPEFFERRFVRSPRLYIGGEWG